MTPRERVTTVLKGGMPDRTPFCFWYHFHLKPPTGPGMAKAELDFFHAYRPDIWKVMHDIDYEDSEIVNTIDDWAKLRSMDGHTGNFGKQAETIKLIVDQQDEDVHVINTVFNTYRYANKCCGEELLDHLRKDPTKVQKGLEAITDSLVSFVEALKDVGADGIYFALHGASTDMATPMEYSGHFLEHDLRVLEAAKGCPLVILHPHSYETLYFDMVKDLPAHVLCWSDRAAGPSLREIRETHKGCLMGGIDETKIAERTPDQIKAEGRGAIEQMRGTPFILAPGCSVPDACPPHLCKAIRPEI